MTIDGVDLNSAANRVANSLALPSITSNKVVTRTATASANATANDTGTSTDSGGSNQITSADFLTLLVTEMQNQDPTQPTDPNEYIQQLVGVNSLQQLIAINGDLSGLSSPSPSSVPATGGHSNTFAPTSAI